MVRYEILQWDANFEAERRAMRVEAPDQGIDPASTVLTYAYLSWQKKGSAECHRGLANSRILAAAKGASREGKTSSSLFNRYGPNYT